MKVVIFNCSCTTTNEFWHRHRGKKFQFLFIFTTFQSNFSITSQQFVLVNAIKKRSRDQRNERDTFEQINYEGDDSESAQVFLRRILDLLSGDISE